LVALLPKGFLRRKIISGQTLSERHNYALVSGIRVVEPAA
jgi:hypothetical protein